MLSCCSFEGKVVDQDLLCSQQDLELDDVSPASLLVDLLIMC
jgi:hypothetical protein